MGAMSVGCGGCWLGPTTTRLAEAMPPFPASFEVMAVVTLFCVPEAVTLTLMENVQDALAVRLAPVRLRLFAPALAVIVPPPQLPVKPFGVEIPCPVGKVSVKPTPLRELVELGLVT